MPPTDLSAVRAAAEQIVCEGLDAWYQEAIDVASYALATIPADATAPITAEWLREVWDKLGGEVDMQSGHPVFVHSEMIGCLCLYGDSYDWRFNGCLIATITTRHQFTQLAACLGIQPQPPKAKE